MQQPFYDAFSLFLAFIPSLAICSGYCTLLSGICTLSSGCFAPFPGICTLACYLFWVLHSAFKHLYPELWVLCSSSWHLYPRLQFVLGTALCFPAFAPSHVIYSGYYSSLLGVYTLAPQLRAIRIDGVKHIALFLLLEYQVSIIAFT